MGRYFGIANRTTNQQVSEGGDCWKGSAFCSCHAVMHVFHWTQTDHIYSACHDTYCQFEYDKETNQMKIVDHTNDWENAEELDVDDELIMDPIQTKPVEFDSFGFPFSGCEHPEIYDHVPKWIHEGDKIRCEKCGFTFDEQLVEECRKLFDRIFFMN